MPSSALYLNPAEAAERLGVSTKALRLYETRGLIHPVRTSAGWRTYGPAEIARAAEIVALRALGISLSQIAHVLDGNQRDLARALGAHQAKLEGEARHLAATIDKVRTLRPTLADGGTPDVTEISRLAWPIPKIVAAFDLPWPWGGEKFELTDMRAINYIIGPLGSGKTRLAQALAAKLPNARFVGLDRAESEAAQALSVMNADPTLKAAVDQTLCLLVEDGATLSATLTALVASLETAGQDILVVDMIEQGLDKSSQEALIAYLRRRGAAARPLFLMTRSSSILDLAAVGPNETITFCPANHSPPIRVMPYPGSSGFDAVATCLGSPDVRARTEGVIAWRPAVA